MSSAAFYDDFLSGQIKSGINHRIYTLYRKLLRIGIRKDEVILEVGCGIGALGFLLAKKIPAGFLEALDLSPKSVAFAREKIRQPNVHFSVANVLDYKPQQNAFDKILLFDVLEHIPKSQHFAVLKQLGNWLKEDGLLLINLPSPHYILFYEKTAPESLQELDQPVFLEELAPLFTSAGLELVRFEMLDIWCKDEYHFLTVRRQGIVTGRTLQADRTFLQKARLRLQREWRKIRHRFP